MECQDGKPLNFPLGMFSFVVNTNDCTELDFNGLSKPPASVSCRARLYSLREFRHPNLCTYIEVVRCKPERIFLITECYTDIFNCVRSPDTDPSWAFSLFLDCMKGLAYMSDNNLVHSFLNPSHIMVDSKGRAKIAGYGIYNALDCGNDCNFPLADPSYSAPEVFLASPICFNFVKTGSLTFDLNIACDVWSVGLIFFQLIHGHVKSNPLLLDDFADNKVVNPLLSVRLLLEGLRQCENGGSKTLPKFLNFQCLPTEKVPSLQKLEAMCCTCLAFNALNRPSPQEIMTNIEAFDRASFSRKGETGKDTKSHSSWTNAADSSLDKAVAFVHDRNVAEMYHYWLLAGGNLKSVWRAAANPPRPKSATSASYRDTAVPNEESMLPSLRRLPPYLAISNSTHGGTLKATKHWLSDGPTERFSFRPEFIRLPGQRLLSRLSKMSPSILYPLLVVPDLLLPADSRTSESPPTTTRVEAVRKGCYSQQVYGKSGINTVFCAAGAFESCLSQPICVREADIEYQVYRVGLFTRLLDGMPTTKKRLQLESRMDIPPFLRAKVWAALLGVSSGQDYRADYVKALSGRRRLASRCDEHQQHYADPPPPPPHGHPCFADRPLTSDTRAVTGAVNALLKEKVATQIGVDLPRCHGYDGILSSAVGQFKLRRVLVATLLRQPGLVEYTQGMDSVAAVFVRLYFPDDALAASCLHNFLKRHLWGFFSSSGLTESLTVVFTMLQRLFAFHAPRLVARLVELEVPLVGLTTGWVYTLFAHAMPLNQTELLWDFLVSSPPVFAAFVYISVFVQMDQQAKLERLSMDSICGLLSNFPDISIDQCREDTIRWALATPVSLTAWPGQPRFPQAPSSEDLSDQQAQAIRHLSFYQRLCTPNAWPEHLELDVDITNTERKPGLGQSTWRRNSLVPVLTPEDAMTHLKRPDCFVLDVRDKMDFARVHIPGSVNRGQPELAMLVVGDAQPDYEIVDELTSESSTPSRLRPKFLVSLMNEEAWQRAVDARLRGQQQQHTRRSGLVDAALVSQWRSPGILVVLDYGGGDISDGGGKGGEHAVGVVTALEVADWLIHQDVDRVCLVEGGAASVLPFLW